MDLKRLINAADSLDRDIIQRYIDYNNNVEENVANYHDFMSDGQEAFDELYNEAQIGDVFSINPIYLKVKTPQELDESSDGQGITNAPIEVSKSNGYFVVFDGHHRLYEAIKSGKKKVRVKVVADDVVANLHFELYHRERRYN